MTVSTNQLPPKVITNAIPKDRRLAVMAILNQEFANRRKPPAVLQEMILQKKPRKPTKTKATTKNNHSNKRDRQLVAKPQSHAGSGIPSSAPLPGVVRATTKKESNTALSVVSTGKNASHTLLSKPSTAKRQRKKVQSKGSKRTVSNNESQKKRKSSRIEVKAFQSGSLLQLQPLTKQDKAAILKRKKQRLDSTSLLQLSQQTNDPPKKRSSFTMVSRSVSPTSCTPSSQSSASATNDWQTRVVCCGTCVGCTTKVNCDRCQQCILRLYAPSFQQPLLRCMHRICSAPMVPTAQTISCQSSEQRPDPPDVVMTMQQAPTAILRRMEGGDGVSPPVSCTKTVEKTRLEP